MLLWVNQKNIFMDIQNLRERIEDLLSHMRDTGYSRLYVWSVDRMSRWLCEQSVSQNWKCDGDVEDTMSGLWTNRHTLAGKIGVLRILQRFDEECAYPDGQRHVTRKSNYMCLNPVYRHIVDCACGERPHPHSRHYNAWLTLSSFLLGLQSQGVTDLHNAGQAEVLQVFSGSNGKKRDQGYRNSVRAAIARCGEVIGAGTAAKLVSYLPSPPHIRRNIQFLTDHEMDALKSVVFDGDGISLRDRAIILTAMYTGLRGVDISLLRLDSIDWERDLIAIRQSKTGQPLELPLRAVVGNAIYDYITEERHKCREPYIFLSVNPPFRRLHTSNLDAVCGKVMDMAGIRQTAGDRRGMHLFRHRVATDMLGNGIPAPVISSTLGHSSPQSLDHYLDAEIVRLRECSLSIAPYPVRKEVFGS